MSKDIKKALEHCINNKCADCPNNEELGSGDIVCRARLLPEILEYISDLQHRLDVAEIALELACETMRYELGRDAIKNLYKDAIKNLKENLNMKTDKEMSQWYLEQAERELKGE